ncbi:MAG: SIR2 family protein [Lachnospiraceae bacterium]|nr:SIR2 family protein [Lachnospiraceae bacterium]
MLACEIIINLIGQAEFGEAAAEEFGRPGYMPAEIHKVIYGLDSKIVITSNVDKIYDECALSESHSTVVVKKYSDKDIAKYLRTNDYLLIKAHGTIDDRDLMIFSHQQYNNARCNYASFYKLLDALILTHTFIFLGCGIDDPDIELIFENANFNHEGCLHHYFVAAEDSITENVGKVLKDNRNLEVIKYSNESGTHKELQKELEKLKELVETKREQMAENSVW